MSKLNFKVKNGLSIKAITAFPVDAEEGDIVLRSDLVPPQLCTYRNGAWATLNDSSYLTLSSTNDTASGSNATLSPVNNNPIVRLTNVTLVSVDMIPAANDGDVIVLANATGTLITLNNDTGATAADRILTGTLKPLKMKDGATVILTYDATTARWRCIGGGGGETPDIVDISESLKNQLVDSYFELLTPNIIKLDEDTLIDGSSTGSFNIADETFNFAASSAQTMVSTNMLDPEEFIANADPLAEVELSTYWNLDNIDTGATYEVSRNGGNEWQAVSMERVGSTDLYRGYHRFDDETVNQILYSPAISGDLTAVNQLSQFVTVVSGSKALLKTVSLTLTKTGAPAGNLYVSICENNLGVPGTVLCESAAISASSLTTGTNLINIPDIYLAAGTYHLKIRTDAAYKASYVNGVTEINLTSTFISGLMLDLRVKITSSATAGIKKLAGYGIFYDKALSANVASGSINLEVFEFDGGLNTYQFALTKFVPHPDLLKVYDVNTGQVYDYGAFSFNGQTVVFESGQFYQPGQTIKLRFIQIEGSAFDNSDVNALLMASNHLGSTDASIDRSVAGRGIFLRRPDGTLREICIDNSDNLIVYSV